MNAYEAIIVGYSGSSRIRLNEVLPILPEIGSRELKMTANEARVLIKAIKCIFEEAADSVGYDDKQVRALTTKFRDAGRRSAPWKPTSSRVPGRPQDGSDGNRINRWLMPEDHKFYANEVDATLVEVKYYLQALSMTGAPCTKKYNISKIFTPWLVRHKVTPGTYADPVQRCILNFQNFIEDPRTLQSGHLDPLDRDGRHVPNNTYLMLFRSNQIQGNMKMDELIDLMSRIVSEHKHNPFI
jgi:hypothetical protein